MLVNFTFNNYPKSGHHKEIAVNSKQKQSLA